MYNLLLFLQTAAGIFALIFLAVHRDLFFGESTETDQYAMKIEPMRPWFFTAMAVVIVLVTLIGVIHILGMRRDFIKKNGKTAGKVPDGVMILIS